ncbi:MAG: DUF72 domain-containing protein [Candidatus Omnitrophota bacterium]
MAESPYLYGPAGWSYKDWEKNVYPEKKPRSFNPLLFLAEKFDFVEVNTSFYRIPSVKLTEGWVQKTETVPNFQFWIKLFQGFTHDRKVLTPDVEAFKASLEPLQRTSQLSGLLVQYPYSFKLINSNLKYMVSLADIFKEYTQAIEFRHNSWNREEVFHIFKEKNLIWVNIDEPVISQSLPLTSVMTHPDTSYFRLHGRNYKNWFTEGRDDRYNYLYNNTELTEIAQKVKELKEMAKKIFISGNNHYKGSAVQNLLELKKLLEATLSIGQPK